MFILFLLFCRHSLSWVRVLLLERGVLACLVWFFFFWFSYEVDADLGTTGD